MAARALLTDADAGMYSRYSFIVYTQAVQGVGQRIRLCPTANLVTTCRPCWPPSPRRPS
jgi:hypothetical protein